MDRITNRREDGELYVYADKFGQALNRLGAYEDTDLMPDEILELIQDIKDIKDSIDETTVAQLRAIVKAAEKGGLTMKEITAITTYEITHIFKLPDDYKAPTDKEKEEATKELEKELRDFAEADIVKLIKIQKFVRDLPNPKEAEDD